ncbi:MAG: hypothetical protein Q9176_000738 [Flavoplaca citrina]
MAELFTALAILSIVSSSASFSAQTVRLRERLGRSDREVETQLHEIRILCEVLNECQAIIDASRNTTIPKSIPQALSSCQVRHVELMDVMNRFQNEKFESNTTVTKFLRQVRQSSTETERSIRLQQQLINMSAGVAELMVNYSDGPDAATTRTRHPEHLHVSEEEDQVAADKIACSLTTDFESFPGPPSAVGHALKDLIKQNFTRNATIVVDSGDGSCPESIRYVHVRAKMDTGCDDNLITMTVVEKAGIHKSNLLEIPANEMVELHGLEGAKCTPLYETILTWYQDGDMKMREHKFYVVEKGPFDMLIGSRRFAEDLAAHDNPALIVGRLRKKKAEREAQKIKKKSHLRQQRDEEVARRDAEAATPIPLSNLGHPSQSVAAQNTQLSQHPAQSPSQTTPQQSLLQSSQSSTQTTTPSPVASTNQVVIQSSTQPSPLPA